MAGCASGSKTHMNIQSEEEALFLTTKKLAISVQSNSCFLSTIARELFLLTSLAALRFSYLLKPLFIFGAGCKLVRLVLGYNLPAVSTFTRDFYSFLSLSNTLPAFLGKFLDLRENLARCYRFRFQCFQKWHLIRH